MTDISITPLAITNAIVLMEDMNGFAEQGILLFSILVVMILTYIILLSSTKIIKTN